MRAWLNPVRQWMFDRLDVREVGDDRTFEDITGTWMGAVGAAGLMESADRGSYQPDYTYSTGAVTFSGGSEVYVLDAPDGEVFVMQSFSLRLDPALGEGDLARLSTWLDLPDGWRFRAERLDEDMEVLSNPDSLAHVLHDDLDNVYLGSDLGRAFSQLVPEDSLW